MRLKPWYSSYLNKHVVLVSGFKRKCSVLGGVNEDEENRVRLRPYPLIQSLKEETMGKGANEERSSCVVLSSGILHTC